jgi:hypothetical protein
LLLAEPFDTILHLLIINKNILLGSCKWSNYERSQPKEYSQTWDALI